MQLNILEDVDGLFGKSMQSWIPMKTFAARTKLLSHVQKSCGIIFIHQFADNQTAALTFENANVSWSSKTGMRRGQMELVTTQALQLISWKPS